MAAISLSLQLWKKNFNTALCSLCHPFVLSLQQGLLNTEAVRAFIAQDSYYLNSFKNAFGTAKSICSSSGDTIGAIAFDNLQRGVVHEMEMHKELSQTMGIDLSIVRPLPSTQLYVDFLCDSSSSNSVACICASMVPCMTLYAFLGQRAVANGLCKDRENNRWVKEYSSEGFQSYSAELEVRIA